MLNKTIGVEIVRFSPVQNLQTDLKFAVHVQSQFWKNIGCLITSRTKDYSCSYLDHLGWLTYDMMSNLFIFIY